VRDADGGGSRIFPASPRDGARAHPDGRYVAEVTVPSGGIASIAIGLEGFRLVQGRPTARADVFFAIGNDPFAAARSGAREGGAGLPRGPAALVLIGVALLVAATRGAWRRGT